MTELHHHTHTFSSSSYHQLNKVNNPYQPNTRNRQPLYLGTLEYYYPRKHPLNRGTLATPTMDEQDSSESYESQTAIQNDPAERGSESRIHFNNSDKPINHWGDAIEFKDDKDVTIYFQNFNSLSLIRNPTKFKIAAKNFNRTKCDIIGLFETCTDWQRAAMIEQTKTILKKEFKHIKLTTSNSRIKATDTHQPGGCLLASTNNCVGRMEGKIKDQREIGRWSGQRFRLSQGRSLYVIAAYRVCPHSYTAIGSQTAYSSQYPMLREDGIETQNPRRSFITDLVQQIKNIRSKEPMASFILMLDANELLGAESNGLADLTRSLEFIDIFLQFQGHVPEIATYDRGKKRIDYILCSNYLLLFVNRCGYLPFYQGNSANHRGAFIDLKPTLYDGLTELQTIPTRGIGSKHKGEVTKYKMFIKEQFEQHRIPQKAQALFERSNDIIPDTTEFSENLNKLDTLITGIVLKAEKTQCARRTGT